VYQQGSPYRCKPAGIPRIPVLPVAAGTGLHRCVPAGCSNILNLKFEKLKNKTKIAKNSSRFIESNSVNFFANLVHLVFFRSYNINQNRKRKNPVGP
jgi:hypothetical protein